MGSKPRYKPIGNDRCSAQAIATNNVVAKHANVTVHAISQANSEDTDMAVAIAALYKDIYAVVAAVPVGQVAAYGQIAALAGRRGAVRGVGRTMRLSKGAFGLPWQRIVGRRGPRRGHISIRDPIGGAIQRRLLESEGVIFSSSGVIDLSRFGWLPM